MTDVRLGYDNEETSLIDYSDNATKIRLAEAETKRAQAQAESKKAEAEKAQAENNKKKLEVREKYTDILMNEQSNPEQKRRAQDFLNSLDSSQNSWEEFFYGLAFYSGYLSSVQTFSKDGLMRITGRAGREFHSPSYLKQRDSLYTSSSAHCTGTSEVELREYKID